MKPKLVHLLNSILSGGIEQGILTLLQHGFYGPFDFHLIELYEGEGPIRQKIIQEAGDRVMSLHRHRPPIPLERSVRRQARKIETIFAIPQLAWRLEKTLRAIGPHSLLLSDHLSQLVGRTVATAHTATKVVSFEHNAVRNNPLMRWGLFLTSWRSDALFGDSKGTLKNRTSYYIRPRPSCVVPLTILHPIAHRVLNDPRSDKFKIVSSGRLYPQKNYIELIHAVAQLMSEGYRLELTIAGEGQERPHLERLIRQLDLTNPEVGIAKQIKLPGWIAEKNELFELLFHSDIYAQPSLYEGFCIAAAEAMGTGIPMVVTNFAGTYDYANDRNMIKIEGHSRKDIANGLRKLMDHYETMAPVMAEEALKTANALYVEGAVLPLWKEAENVLASPRKASLPNSVPPFKCEHCEPAS